MIDRNWIAAHIPHQGTMCLLDGVDSWDERHIICQSSSQSRVDNPLRAQGTLGIANAIEYAAQAMAVHGALLARTEGAPKAGYLTSVRDVRWHCADFDGVTAALSIRATRITGNDTSVLYSFDIVAGPTLLISGRASVMLDAAMSGT